LDVPIFFTHLTTGTGLVADEIRHGVDPQTYDPEDDTTHLLAVKNEQINGMKYVLPALSDSVEFAITFRNQITRNNLTQVASKPFKRHRRF